MRQTSKDHPLKSIALKVKNLERSTAFYQEHLGSSLHKQKSRHAWLGTSRDAFLELLERPQGEKPLCDRQGYITSLSCFRTASPLGAV